MRILVWGAGGMLGHKLYQVLAPRLEVFATVRRPASDYDRFNLFNPKQLLGGIDGRRTEDILTAFAWAKPDVVLNAAGLVPQRERTDMLEYLEVNSLLPHRLALACQSCGARLIHFSTDCVFSGRLGSYTEDSLPDAQESYGLTKLLGEVRGGKALTIRTSMIGRELNTHQGLLEWFFAKRNGQCRGYTRAIFSGLTTRALAGLTGEIIEKHPDLHGLYHVSADPISKYDLLGLINSSYGLGINVERDAEVVCDRSLDSTRFRIATGWRPDPWAAMVSDLRIDPTPYDRMAHERVA